MEPFTEAQVQERVEMIMALRTAIVTAHRLLTLRNADRIIVMKDGDKIEEGDCDGLMDQGGHYAEQ